MGRPVVNLAGKRFGKLKVFAQYGRDKHGGVLWKCLCSCGNTTVVRSSSLKHKDPEHRTRSCGCLLKAAQRPGSGNANWKGGRSKNKQGYIMLSGHQDHPRANKNGQIAEHIVVMELRLGRYLYDKETVHHKNGQRDDNRDENLELWASSHPSGQRVEDLVSWSVDMLERYAPEKLVQN